VVGYMWVWKIVRIDGLVEGGVGFKRLERYISNVCHVSG
jgi:hypothetical protein